MQAFSLPFCSHPSCKVWWWVKCCLVGGFLILALLWSVHAVPPRPAVKPVVDITLAFGGDLLLSKRKSTGVATSSTCEIQSFSSKENPRISFWTNVTQLLNQADWRMFNLETPVSTKKYAPTLLPTGRYKKQGFQVSEVVGSILEQAGIDMCTLANNHLVDIPTGVADTRSFLTGIGICGAGAGKSMEDATKPCIFRVNGIRIAIFSAADLRSIRGGDETREFTLTSSATEQKSGIWDLHTGKMDSLVLNWNASLFSKIAHKVALAQQQADLVIFSIHWQKNDASFVPQRPFVRFAHCLVDAGVDIVIGGHPHHIQPIEVYKQKLIVYGTGEALRAYPNPGFAHRRYEISVLYRVQVQCSTLNRKKNKCILKVVWLTPLLLNHYNCSVSIHPDLVQAKEFLRTVNLWNKCPFSEGWGHLELDLTQIEAC
eukprot:scaffold1733_cov450-Pavlova_lutheri.AAC.2